MTDSEVDCFTYKPIGVIHSPHRLPEETPIQPIYAIGVRGWIEIDPQYEAGLQDLDEFSHIHLIYALHLAGAPQLVVKPFLADQPHGVFATRSPTRPNAIGMSLVRLIARDGCRLEIEDVDILDGTPLLDIKPYVSRIDSREGARCGWQDRIDPSAAITRGKRAFRESGPSKTNQSGGDT